MAHFGILTPRLYRRVVPQGMKYKKNTMKSYNEKMSTNYTNMKHHGTVNVKNDSISVQNSLF